MLFHDAVQTPEWMDGRRPGALPAEDEDVLLQVGGWALLQGKRRGAVAAREEHVAVA